jgi:hypothetical protein
MYKQAADLYEMDGKSSDMYKMLEKWCDLTILTVSG